MRKRTLVLSLFAAGALVAAGCEPDAKTAAVGNPNALLGDEADEAIEPLDEEGVSDPDAVTGTWVSGSESAATAALALVVTNNSGSGFPTVTLGANGVVGSASVSFGEVALGAGESAELSIDAASLPLRSTLAVNQLFATMRWNEETPGGPVERSSTTERVFYQHEEGYGAVRVYTSASFKEEVGGVLFASDLIPGEIDPGDLESAADVIPVAEVVDEVGVHTVTMAESDLLLKDGSGQPFGMITRVIIAEGNEDPSGEEVGDE